MSENIKKDNFILYNNMYDMLEDLSNEDLGEVIKSIFRYSINDEVPEYEKGSVKAIIFKSIKNSIDINNKKYKERCIKNAENAKKRWDKIVYDNQELTKEEYERLTAEKYDATPFDVIFNHQKSLYEQGRIHTIQDVYNCGAISKERIRKVFKE